MCLPCLLLTELWLPLRSSLEVSDVQRLPLVSSKSWWVVTESVKPENSSTEFIDNTVKRLFVQNEPQAFCSLLTMRVCKSLEDDRALDSRPICWFWLAKVARCNNVDCKARNLIRSRLSHFCTQESFQLELSTRPCLLPKRLQICKIMEHSLKFFAKLSCSEIQIRGFCSYQKEVMISY